MTFSSRHIRPAHTTSVMQGYRHFASMARAMDVHFRIIEAAECGRRHPLISTENLFGGLWDAHDGNVDPAPLCQALARAEVPIRASRYCRAKSIVARSTD